jgi:hypothetical protein
MGYYLIDGIYPECAAFMKTVPPPQTDKQKLFAKFQEGVKKDVEHSFGVLQFQFTLIIILHVKEYCRIKLAFEIPQYGS